MEKLAISINSISKVYNLYNNPADRVKEVFNPLRKKYHKEYYALNNISLNIRKGESVGIIGKNGAGKSTLLKIITGVLTQSSGDVVVDGRISSLLELGTGFNPEMTGIENIYLNGTIMGFSKEDVDEKLNEIIAFADIGDFIHQPVRLYSSGMFARLAFSVAISVDPDILIVDEALSVGDVRFQQKCYRKFRTFQDAGKTILFVTHDTNTIINYCTYAIWLSDGQMVDQGEPEAVCKRYMAAMAYDQKTEISDTAAKEEVMSDSFEWLATDGFESFGEKGAVITGIAMVDENGNHIDTFKGGETATVKVKMYANESLRDLIAGFVVLDNLGNNIFGSNTQIHNYGPVHFEAGKEYVVNYTFEMPKLRNGQFTISPALAEGAQGEHIQHHWVHNALIFSIQTNEASANAGLLIRDINSKIKVD